ncbi:MAG: hypothetical protein Q4G46_06535 [Propionibacteriaceae bacterium]|nr:hypothetical protein [Propionibacteriaceae bacterium]
MAVTAPFFIFFALSLRQVYVSDERETDAWREYLLLRVITSATALAIVVVFGLINQSLTTIFVIVALVKAVDLISDIYLAPAQAAGRVWAIGAYNIVNGVVSLGLFALGLLFWPPVYALALSIVGSLAAATCAFVVGRRALRDTAKAGRRSAGFHATPRSLGRLALLAAPLGIAGFLNSATQAAPRFVLERTDSLASVGIFSAMAYLLIAGNTVVSAVVQHGLPQTVQVLRKHGRKAMNRRIRRLTLAMAAMSTVAVGVVWLWGEPVITWLYGPGYVHRPTLLLIAVGWAIGAVSWMWDMALVVERAFVTQMVAAGAGTVASVILSVTAVSHLGLFGAGLATLAASLAVAVVRVAGLVRIANRRGEESHA